MTFSRWFEILGGHRFAYDITKKSSFGVYSRINTSMLYG